MPGLPSSLSKFIDEVDTAEKTLLLVNRTEPKPFVDLLSEAFANQSVTVAEKHVPEGPDNFVCLVEDGRVTATTPLSELAEAFLLVNVDRYRTGTRQPDLGTFPDVLTGLSDVEFVVAGFPQSVKEKLLLIVISRFIEHQALTDGTGELHSTFHDFHDLTTSTELEKCTKSSPRAASIRTFTGSGTSQTRSMSSI